MNKLSLTIIAASALSVTMMSFKTGPGDPKKKKPGKDALDLSYIDKRIKPGDNFFRYANGKWLDTAVIPATETGAGSFYDLDKSTRNNIKKLLEAASAAKSHSSSIEQLVGDFYASGMDTLTIEKLGYTPLQPTLAALDAVQDIPSLLSFVADQEVHGGSSFFSWGIGPDEKNSAYNIAGFYQGGIGLPDRDYYFKTDAATKKVVDAYKKYLTTLFELTGSDKATAEKNTETVFAIEKSLAGAHRTRVELRDPQSNYNKFTVDELNTKEPLIGWRNFLNAVGAKTDAVVVGQPAYYEKLNALLDSVPVQDWKTYYRARVLSSNASKLSSAFVNAQFAYSQSLSGAQKIRPRWERIYAAVNGNIGEALGQLYVKKYFTQEAKDRMDVLVDNLQKAYANRIKNVDWMSDSTKKIALDKLSAFIKKIGYPTKWRDYSKVKVNRNTYFANCLSAAENEYQFQLSQLDKPVDKTLWYMTPPTINAYYNPTTNEIVFPAGILQPPFFNPQADDAVNYGGIGMVIGHEMTHGFDDQGSQYDKDGNMKDWWTKSDKEKFEAKVKQVVEQYNQFTVLDSLHVNGALTTGENMADIGGIAIAYDAFKLTKEGQSKEKIDGFTPDQRFFLSFAQIWRSKYKDETVRQRINVDPHSPAEWRVIGPLENFTPFYKAFDVKPGDKWYKPESERIKIW